MTTSKNFAPEVVGALLVGALWGTGCTAEVVTQEDELHGPSEVGRVRQALERGVHAFAVYWAHDPLDQQDHHFNFWPGVGELVYTSSGTGAIDLRFVDLPGSYGNVQVSALGTDDARCKVAGWYKSGSDRVVSVRCHDANGNPTNSSFVAHYNAALAGSWGGAYLWANDPTAWSYDPSSSYSWNEWGHTNSIRRRRTGVYDNRLPGLGFADGFAHVTAYGTGSEYCNVSSWWSDGDDRIVRVRCFDSNGSPVNTRYSLDYKPTHTPGLWGTGAMALANQPYTNSYTPPASASSNTGACQPSGREIVATRSSRGVYTMRFNGMAAPGVQVIWTAALVSGYGYNGPGYCKIGTEGSGIFWWLPVDQMDIEVPVRCFDDDGEPMDRQYLASFLTPWVAGLCSPSVVSGPP